MNGKIEETNFALNRENAGSFFNTVKESLNPDDFQKYKGTGYNGDRASVNKSGALKILAVMGGEAYMQSYVQISDDHLRVGEKPDHGFHVIYECVLPNGQKFTGVGTALASETITIKRTGETRQRHENHQIFPMAETRALIRSIIHASRLDEMALAKAVGLQLNGPSYSGGYSSGTNSTSGTSKTNDKPDKELLDDCAKGKHIEMNGTCAVCHKKLYETFTDPKSGFVKKQRIK